MSDLFITIILIKSVNLGCKNNDALSKDWPMHVN